MPSSACSTSTASSTSTTCPKFSVFTDDQRRRQGPQGHPRPPTAMPTAGGGFNDHIPVQHPPGHGRVLLHEPPATRGSTAPRATSTAASRRDPRRRRGPHPPRRHRPGSLLHRHPQPPRRGDRRRGRDVHLRQHRRRPGLVDPLHPHGGRRLLRLPLRLQADRGQERPASEKTIARTNHDAPFQPYTLWRIAEYGGGSPTGAVGYNEDALPAGVPRQPVPLRVGQGRRSSASSSSATAARSRSSSTKTC